VPAGAVQAGRHWSDSQGVAYRTGRSILALTIALGLLVATGLGNLWLHPYFLRLPRLHWKLGLVALALVLAVVHDFVLGPRAGKPGAAPSVRVRASWIARINVLVVLVIVLLGLGLLR